MMPIGFRSLFTRERFAEMLAPAYASMRLVDVNEAYGRMEDAVQSTELCDRIARATFLAYRAAHEELSDEKLLERARKRLLKKKRFGPPKVSRADEGAWAAVLVRLDVGAGMSGGEGFELLATEEGRSLEERGLARLGAHLAKQIG
ncbi:MAG: hypothetical protein HYV07_30330 [Deltaproteobacteria bacterium]|nr:hypothetical protein [Deltaproteobacteria bacterium]